MASKWKYDNGLPFLSDLKTYFLDPIRKQKRDAKVIIIDGIPGTGKTTMGVHLADYYAGKPIKLLPENHPQLAMGGGDFIEKVIYCSENGYNCAIYDEAGDFAKGRFMTKFNHQLYDFFSKARAFNVVMVICVQRFWDMDSRIYNLGVVHGLIHCYEKHDTYTRYGVYDVEGIGYLRTHAEKFKNNPQLAYKRQRPYIYGTFLDLTPRRRRMLRALSLGEKKKTVKKKRKEAA